MAEYSKTVPKHPTDCDETIRAVLDAVIFYTDDGDTLVRYEIRPAEVVLTFEAIE
jgi:hypothetical protein